MATVNLGQVAALIQSVSVEALDAGAAPTVKNVGTKANAEFVFGIPIPAASTDDYVLGQEVKINKTFAGKPVYRKCGYVDSVPFKTEFVVDNILTQSYIDAIVQTGGCAKASTDSTKTSIGGYSNSSLRTCIASTTAGLSFLASDDTYLDVYWWIEYTKTAD